MLYNIKKFIENNKYFVPLIAVSASLLLVLSIGVLIMNSRLNALSVRYNASLDAFNAANDKLFSENMAAFEKTLLGSFNEQQLVRIAQKNTKYGISINGTPLGLNESVVYSERPTIAVLLSENYGKDTLNLLPRSVVEMGSIIELEKASELIKVTYGEATMENNVYDYFYGKTLSYLMSNLKAGDIVTIEVTPDIARKIGLEDNIIEIIYNKEFVEAS